MSLDRICRTLATENLTDIGEYVQANRGLMSSRGAEWYTLFFAYQSSLTLLLSLVWEPRHEKAHDWQQVRV